MGVREGAITSLETKLSVVPGRKADGQIMADCVEDDIVQLLILGLIITDE